ncbi:hypothetical protein BpHYR1_025498 [Brachionus plicatilis]|uniref:Uncharacterized protein n=1 Tax=Brachionus plicatilis TaxID=10195 RepID=A0A3M7PID8_BRAPC|nr:hypothetical protein BpHYR1_025498 [Brachionus plicatilis]
MNQLSPSFRCSCCKVLAFVFFEFAAKPDLFQIQEQHLHLVQSMVAWNCHLCKHELLLFDLKSFGLQKIRLEKLGLEPCLVTNGFMLQMVTAGNKTESFSITRILVTTSKLKKLIKLEIIKKKQAEVEAKKKTIHIILIAKNLVRKMFGNPCIVIDSVHSLNMSKYRSISWFRIFENYNLNFLLIVTADEINRHVVETVEFVIRNSTKFKLALDNDRSILEYSGK